MTEGCKLSNQNKFNRNQQTYPDTAETELNATSTNQLIIISITIHKY